MPDYLYLICKISTVNVAWKLFWKIFEICVSPRLYRVICQQLQRAPSGNPLLPSGHHLAVNKTSYNGVTAAIFLLLCLFPQSALFGGWLQVHDRGLRLKALCLATLQAHFLLVVLTWSRAAHARWQLSYPVPSRFQSSLKPKLELVNNEGPVVIYLSCATANDALCYNWQAIRCSRKTWSQCSCVSTPYRKYSY